MKESAARGAKVARKDAQVLRRSPACNFCNQRATFRGLRYQEARGRGDIAVMPSDTDAGTGRRKRQEEIYAARRRTQADKELCKSERRKEAMRCDGDSEKAHLLRAIGEPQSDVVRDRHAAQHKSAVKQAAT